MDFLGAIFFWAKFLNIYPTLLKNAPEERL